MNTNRSFTMLSCLFVAALGLGACALPEEKNVTPAVPLAAPSINKEKAAPLARREVQPTATPVPTSTPLPTPTLTATATPVPPTPKPTANRTATAQAVMRATTEAQIAAIDKQLQKYGLSTEQGHLGWVADTLKIKVDSYGEGRIDTQYPDFSVGDFVLQTDLKWESQTGLAGCTVIVRSEADLVRGKQYRIYFMRLGGKPLWDIEYFRYDKYQAVITGKILNAVGMNSAQGATNTITIVAQGTKLTVYVEGQRLGTFTDSKLAEGAIAFMAWQESGETTCTYSNTWLWVLDADK